MNAAFITLLNQVTNFHATVCLLGSELVSGITVHTTIYYLMLPLLSNKNTFSVQQLRGKAGKCDLVRINNMSRICD